MVCGVKIPKKMFCLNRNRFLFERNSWKMTLLEPKKGPKKGRLLILMCVSLNNVSGLFYSYSIETPLKFWGFRLLYWLCWGGQPGIGPKWANMVQNTTKEVIPIRGVPVSILSKHPVCIYIYIYVCVCGSLSLSLLFLFLGPGVLANVLFFVLFSVSVPLSQSLIFSYFLTLNFRLICELSCVVENEQVGAAVGCYLARSFHYRTANSWR